MRRILSPLVLVGALAGCTTIYQLPPYDLPIVDPYQSDVHLLMNDIRRIASMVEGYAVDNNVYPRSDAEGITIAGERFVPIRVFDELLVPYRQPVSAVDPWGQPYLYWTDSRAQLYLVVSGGSDRSIDTETVAKALAFAQGRKVFIDGKPSACLDDEIVFSSGSFLLFPRASARPCRPVKVDGSNR